MQVSGSAASAAPSSFTRSAATPPTIAASAPVAEVWAAVIEQLPSAMVWARRLVLQRIELGVAHLAPAAGHNDLFKFMTQPRRDELAALLSRVTGQPIKVDIAAPSQSSGDGGNSSALASSSSSSLSPRDRALNAPLVREIFQLFPDSTIVDVRPEQPATATVTDAASASDSDSDSDTSIPSRAERRPFDDTPPDPDDYDSDN
jgi:hypothetical protein